MFVAMARHMGIDGRFQEVDIPPDWTAEGSAFVLSRHVNGTPVAEKSGTGG